MKTIELVVLPTGESKLETRGFAGDACRAASQFVETALGLSLADQQTAEAFTSLSESAFSQSH